ncbi:hypothetical protein O9H85_08800 [Paenibacillus filicis]|uniref:DUF3168 domain-containing protein n=1 Tax=Paenibacillus gyeongsangnamensis TaxID=3388067 RepID=A0ABT4Q6L4_9BACL|nr:hypothetical protein [Paenibacillus filicis]MCZ8512513.1 hypothetical protein [Paenibacillus filicis]
MSQTIQAYFYTENEAEDVRIKLQAYPVERIEIGVLPDTLDRDTPLLYPFAIAGAEPSGVYVAGASGTGAASGDASTAGAFFGLRFLDAEANDQSGDGVEDRTLRYSLSVTVREEDYDEAVHLIRRNQGHVAAGD